MIDIPDPDRGRVPDVDRASVHFGERGRYRDSFHDLLRRHRPHGDDHLARKNACRHRIDPCDIHGNVPAHRVVAHLDPGLDQLRFEAEGTADEEAHQVISPELLHIRVFPCAYTLFIDPVLGEVLGDIAVFCHELRKAAAGVEDFEHGAGLRVTLREQQEIVRMLLGEHDQVRLRVAGAEAARRLRELPLADEMPHLYRCHIFVIIDHINLHSGALCGASKPSVSIHVSGRLYPFHVFPTPACAGRGS